MEELVNYERVSGSICYIKPTFPQFCCNYCWAILEEVSNGELNDSVFLFEWNSFVELLELIVKPMVLMHAKQESN